MDGLRLAWAGLCAGRFVLLTHLANMGFAKPHSEYYRQICAMIGVPAVVARLMA